MVCRTKTHGTVLATGFRNSTCEYPDTSTAQSSAESKTRLGNEARGTGSMTSRVPVARPDDELSPPDPDAPGALAPPGASMRLSPGVGLAVMLRGTLGIEPALGTGLKVILPDSVRTLGSYLMACSGATTSSEGGTCRRSLMGTSVAFSSHTHECNDTTLVRPTSWMSTTIETVALSCGEYKE